MPDRHNPETQTKTLGDDQQTRGRSIDLGIERGMADIRAGRLKPAEDVFDRLELKYTRMLQDRE